MLVSPDFTEKHGLSTMNTKDVVCGNMFLNGIVVVPPAFTVYGPCGLGAREWPTNGNTYSPPVVDVIVNVLLQSPILVGSNVTSTPTSLPPLEAEAAVKERSTRNSGLST